MTEGDVPLQSLTIYLAKAGYVGADQLVDEVGNLNAFPITDQAGSLGTLYVEARSSKIPPWSKFFVLQVDPRKLGRVSSAAAVLLVLVEGRTLALTFGQGRHLLKQGCWEERFGLRVTLNSIGSNNVRSIDKHTLDTVGLHSRVQMSREATAGEFGLDIERDLLSAITGTPIDKSIGHTLSGLDSLHANVRVGLPTLRALLTRYLEQFGKDAYKETFPWIDHISEVKDAALKVRLDALMLAEIADQRTDRCWLAVPDPIEWTQVAGFRYRKGAKQPIHHDVRMDTFLEDFGTAPKDVSRDLFAEHQIMAVDGEDSIKYHWPAYRCICGEVDLDGGTYLLSRGHWYKVASDYVSEVNAFYEQTQIIDLGLPEYNDGTEGAYNKRVAEGNPKEFALMDQKEIMIGGGQSRVEFCDLMGRSKDLIHIKRYGGAGALSHLFAQGVVSGEAFVEDERFRKQLNERLPEAFRLADVDSRPESGAYRVVFAVISREEGASLTLPFFSRVSFRHAVKTLHGGCGYKVALAKISVNEEYAKLKKYKSKKHA